MRVLSNLFFVLGTQRAEYNKLVAMIFPVNSQHPSVCRHLKFRNPFIRSTFHFPPHSLPSCCYCLQNAVTPISYTS